ncbi:MAG: orotate phosphoribosyltransferase [Bacteroidetes bacterium]|nr:MAG: orotate phosphoribosyltransferase [Bacteroidota bacterium]
MQKTEVAKKIAEDLLKIGAIKLKPNEPFKWSSGWNSPIYCDNRLALSYPEVRTFIKEQLSAVIKAQFADVEAIAGVATAGIPQGALVADLLNLPFLYVRPTPKNHGMENLIEGKITPNQKVVLVEDLISTGGSSLKAAAALQKAGFNVQGMVAIFTYSFAIADENFEKENIKLVTLSNYPTLINVCEEKNIYSKTDIESLNNWRKSPETWKI